MDQQFPMPPHLQSKPSPPPPAPPRTEEDPAERRHRELMQQLERLHTTIDQPSFSIDKLLLWFITWGLIIWGIADIGQKLGDLIRIFDR